ncbi:MAG: transcriptional repressor [Anaerolineae bacterium]|nr:transcriptional repressor [Anaerolineae bacterium]
MQSLDTLLELFHQEGKKITPQRRVILELLLQDERHLTIDELYRRVLAVMPDVSRTTIYNTLHDLEDLGVVKQVQDLSEGGGRYDVNIHFHHHLFCMRCHALVDVEREFEGVTLTTEEAAGYEIARYQVTFFGICPDCQRHNEE